VPPVGDTVDLEKATYTNSIGAVELKTVWTDPEFDPSVPAFYYARVLEVPTPRWTTIQAAKLGIAPPDVVAATVQERAWSSPIWYSPTTEARKVAKAGPTIDDLKKQGAVALTDPQLKALIAGKSPWLQNNVTGRNSDHYGASDRQFHANAHADQPRLPDGKTRPKIRVRACRTRRQRAPAECRRRSGAEQLSAHPSPYYINNASWSP
jgi:hypothetical protein